MFAHKVQASDEQISKNITHSEGAVVTVLSIHPNRVSEDTLHRLVKEYYVM